LVVGVLTPESLIEQLLTLPDLASQRRFLDEHVGLLAVEEQDEVAALLKKKADRFLRSDIQGCLDMAELILHMAELSGDSQQRALGLRARANAFGHGGLGLFREAVELYDEVAEIYRANDNVVYQAITQNAKLVPLARLGRYDEAIEIGRWAGRILEEHGELLWLAKLCVNLGIISRRMGEDVKALKLYDRACELYRQLEGDREASLSLARAEQNRGVVLRHLGRFEESLQASQTAFDLLSNSGQRIEAARAQQNLAVTYFVLGRYNEALELLDKVREIFRSDGRQRDAILVDLFISDCLLQLRRFDDVLIKSQQARVRFAEIETSFEVAQSILNEAIAYAGLARYRESFDALREARALFAKEGYSVWVASTDLETAVVMLHQGRTKEALETSLACAQVFEEHDSPVEKAQAQLVAARAAVESGQYERAHSLVTAALTVAQSQNIPTLLYQASYLLGALALVQGDLKLARVEYDRAAAEMERLRGRLMIEFRADFLEDKQVVYEDLVQLSLELDEPGEGLVYAERAKSRALLELLAFRLNLGVELRAQEDQPLIEELTRLRAKRDRLYRSWDSGEVTNERGETTVLTAGQQLARRDVLALEKRITELWHKLLIRNADYARDAALWQVRAEPIQPHLDRKTALVEYFIAKGQLIAFIVTHNGVQARRLPVKMPEIQRLLQLFWLNLRAVPKSSPERMGHLTVNAQGILQRLYQHLFAPLGDLLNPYQRLIIVPHGALHYLPFHALRDGDAYLLSQFEVSYLPSASLMSYERARQQEGQGLIAVGHSQDGRLPYTVQEARAVAARWPGEVFVEDEATLALVRDAAAECQILHLATHAEFRADNPLFSGMALADGWLTTLEIFNLRLRASLVTLSACQTGRNVVGGGDELLGLMRAFLSAGAGSLVLSLWAVEDRSTAQIMESFYAKLSEGCSKAAALRRVLLEFDHGHYAEDTKMAEVYRHPYFWAPFYLVGAAGPL
jgi:CHAT domain-containing protein/tetratricopeptide (TPR) repeat protein